MALTTGTQAPDFTLKTKTADGLEEVTLSANYGKKKTVLLFFPLAFSSVCMDELCAVDSSLSDYTNLNAAVYGISVDNPFAQEAMAEKGHLHFPLLSDFNKEVSQAYDLLYDEFIGYKGVAKRSACVIDENGLILHSESSDDPTILPDFDAIKKVLED
jgi:peroxiredoxin